MKAYNPFLYSDDNKRYHTWNYYLRHRFQEKIGKVALNANFSCPNRDGTCGVGGCSFCGSLGAGEYAGAAYEPLSLQFERGSTTMQKKWPHAKTMAYFQAYTNTYASLSTLQETFDPFIKRDDVIAISIATRADCLEDEKIAYLQSLTKEKEIWVELGLQSIHDETARHINRGHTYATFLDCVQRLSHTDIKLCVHIINSLPYETKEMMIATAKALAHLPIHAVKIHMLYVMEDTFLAQQYQEESFPILSKEEYIDLVITQLECFPATFVIQRLTGDSMEEKLIAPQWSKQKIQILNDIDKEMKRRNTWQGKRFDQGS